LQKRVAAAVLSSAINVLSSNPPPQNSNTTSCVSCSHYVPLQRLTNWLPWYSGGKPSPSTDCIPFRNQLGLILRRRLKPSLSILHSPPLGPILPRTAANLIRSFGLPRQNAVIFRTSIGENRATSYHSLAASSNLYISGRVLVAEGRIELPTYGL
jgi:hypothetical protein